MPTRRYYANAAPQQKLASSVTSSATSITISDSFSGWPTQFPFYAAFDINTASIEVVLVTSITGTTATVTRGQGGTPAVAHPAGATFDPVLVAQDADEANAHTTSNSGVHGVAGSVVGTSDVQTLTNKTMSSPIVTGTVANGATNNLTGAGTALNVTNNASIGGNATVGGTLNVTGATTLAGNVNLSGTGTPLNVTGSASIGGTVTAGGSTGGALPTGSLVMFGGTAAPAGFLLCDGSLVSRTTYADLFTAIGTTYGNGDGSTTFALPNLVNKFPRGNTASTGGGADTHSHTTSGFANIVASGNTIYEQRGTHSWTSDGKGTGLTTSADTTAQTQGVVTSGTSSTDSNVPAYVGVAFIIKT